jgi:hypothetical protein
MARNLGSRSWVGIVPDPLKSIIWKDALFLKKGRLESNKSKGHWSISHNQLGL